MELRSTLLVLVGHQVVCLVIIIRTARRLLALLLTLSQASNLWQIIADGRGDLRAQILLEHLVGVFQLLFWRQIPVAWQRQDIGLILRRLKIGHFGLLLAVTVAAGTVPRTGWRVVLQKVIAHDHLRIRGSPGTLHGLAKARFFDFLLLYGMLRARCTHFLLVRGRR